MINSISRVVLLIGLALFLASCVSMTKQPGDKQAFAACRVACQQAAKQCNRVCRNNCPQCTAYANQTAARHYRKYVHEVCVEGGIIARDLKSYRDPLQCRKTTCNCRADYQVCMQSCGGVIHKRLQVSPVC
ncbi:acyltransferase [Legionella spiritensis]|uniref:Acyltransferase n=1 Tax=Legionella spiritensis TaxID=452 RepID=A0A0W0YYK3_LEGSP|nr:acyltransferase [Legionella spiritensis]KTD61667.1 acyltransferase [Legionella spiritensis]SNV39041.1 acyltransferase [Legionella spiritensis]VEG90320.1 acyltransferase [Legionella spiritensis]